MVGCPLGLPNRPHLLNRRHRSWTIRSRRHRAITTKGWLRCVDRRLALYRPDDGRELVLTCCQKQTPG